LAQVAATAHRFARVEIDLAMNCNINDPGFVNGATATILAEFM
jgi:hypothetical protein